MRPAIVLTLLSIVLSITGMELVGEEMLDLERQGLKEYYPVSSRDSIEVLYRTSVEQLSKLYRGSLPDFFRDFCDVLGPRYATKRRADLLSRDLVESRYDCSTLSTMLLDAYFMASGKLLDFAVTEHHVFLTDGDFDYDPMRKEIRPVSGRDETVQVGVDPSSLTCRTIGLVYRAMANDTDDPQLRDEFLTAAQSWFEAGLNYDVPDFMIQAEQARE